MIAPALIRSCDLLPARPRRIYENWLNAIIGAWLVRVLDLELSAWVRGRR